MGDRSTNPQLATLFESPSLPAFELPQGLEAIYGRFGLPPEVVYANFVSSLDGAVALQGVQRASPIISGGSAADRFVVALLRASADAVVIGAGTYRAHAGPWTPANAYPDLTAAFAQMRRGLGLRGEPVLVVVTRSGKLGPPKPALEGSIIVSTTSGQRPEPGVLGASEVLDMSGSESVPRDLVGELRRRGFARILTEGGPQLMGDLLGASVVDELFLTVSPLVFGSTLGEIVGIADGARFEGDQPVRAIISSVRKDDSHLFLRYSIENSRSP